MVSIPFKREGVSELVQKSVEGRIKRRTFLFPSNGKAFLNLRVALNDVERAILFLFPSNGKAFLNYKGQYRQVKVVKFLFPSNGKAFLNDAALDALYEIDDVEFLFPSNGTAFLND